MENLRKIEFMATQIIAVAAKNGITIAELELAADMAKEISKKTVVEKSSVDKFYFLSSHICTSNNELFF